MLPRIMQPGYHSLPDYVPPPHAALEQHLGISRDFLFRERLRLHFRSELFNVANHPNFGLPVLAIGSPTVGIIGSVANSERQIQFAMKLQF